MAVCLWETCDAVITVGRRGVFMCFYKGHTGSSWNHLVSAQGIEAVLFFLSSALVQVHQGLELSWYWVPGQTANRFDPKQLDWSHTPQLTWSTRRFRQGTQLCTAGSGRGQDGSAWLVGPRWEQASVSSPSCPRGLAFAAPRSSALPSTPLASRLLLLEGGGKGPRNCSVPALKSEVSCFSEAITRHISPL